MPAITLRPAPRATRIATVAGVRAHLGLWLRRIRDRRALAALHPDQIREAGLDPVRLRAEMRKPFWRA